MVNYVTPGYATAVFVSVQGLQRVRTTAESHRRIAIVEVMGRHSGYIALGTAYGQPDIVLVPEVPVHIPALVERVRELYELQKNVVIVCGEGIVGEDGRELGAKRESHDPAGNVTLSGASDALRDVLIDHFGDAYFRQLPPGGVRQGRGLHPEGRPHPARGPPHPLRPLPRAASWGARRWTCSSRGRTTPSPSCSGTASRASTSTATTATPSATAGASSTPGYLHPSFYDQELMRPSKTAVEYMLPIFTNAIGHADIEAIRQTVFDAGSLFRPYHSVNTDINKRIRHLA